MTGPPDPPDWVVGPYARAAWQNAYVAVIARMEWDEGFEGMLGQMAMFAQAHVRDVHHENELLTVTSSMLDYYSVAIEEKRLCLRGPMADYMLVDPDMVDAPGTIRADGLDRDVAHICDVPELQ